uniref:Uncharacterized plant-specific domain 01589 n=1 Tax=Medicago truncatula TaxID=3880 RepID=A2Q300_MEDTR|nr:Uncharacterized plant-specific domain 01589 [Medicago truncatula]
MHTLITRQDVDQVQDLIERCILLYMTPKEIVSTLHEKAKIEPKFTKIVWQKLNEQNPEFFKAYYTRLALKQQIEKFNELLEKQKELMDSQTNVASLPNSNESHIPAIPENPAYSHVSVQTPEGLNSKNLQHGVVSNFSDLFNNKGSSFGMVDTSAHGDIPSMTFTQNSNMGMQQGVNGGMTISKPDNSSFSPHMFGADGKVGGSSAMPFPNFLNRGGSSFGKADMFVQGDIPSMAYTHNTNMGVQQGINGGMNTSKPGYSSYSPHMFGAHGNVVNASATSFTNAESSSHHGIEAVLETLDKFYGSPFINLGDNNSPQTREQG